MKKLLLLTTGGTIASRQGPMGLEPQESQDILRQVLRLIAAPYQVTVETLLTLDSSNIQPEEWRRMAQRIAQAQDGYDGIVLTHGTDTLAYTASALSFMLQGLTHPVVLTGAQLPLCHPLSDGSENLRCALAMAASGHPGVFVAFDRHVLLGTRAVKVRTTGFDAFESVNLPFVGTVDARGLTLEAALLPRPHSPFRLLDRLCAGVFLIKLTPGLNPELFTLLDRMHYRGLVIEAFGAGGMHVLRRNLVDQLARLIDGGLSVVVCSQCLYEHSDLTRYQVGRQALQSGMIPGRDMTTESAVTKLMWALGQTDSPSQVREWFNQDLAGEVTLP